MRKLPSLLAVLLLLLAAQSQGATNCNPIPIPNSGNVQGPAEANQVKVTTRDGQPVQNLTFTVNGGIWKVESSNVVEINSALDKRPENRNQFQLTWFKGSDAIQTDSFQLPGEDAARVCPPQPSPPVGVPSTKPKEDEPPVNNANDEERCRELYKEWEREIASRLPNGRFLAILFAPDGQILDENKNYGVAGDLIYTAICKDSTFGTGNPRLKFSKCDLQSPIPKNPEGDTQAFKQQRAGEPELVKFPPRQCFGSSFEIKITGKRGAREDLNETHTIGMYERYRYTLQVAALNTEQHVHAFGLQKDGDDMKILDKGPVDQGPEYVASIVLYGLPHYFQRAFSRVRGGVPGDLETLAGRVYYGRDVVNEHGIADRIGFVVGAGLNSPGDRFVTGLSFELAPGVNLIGVYELAKLKQLAGVSEDDVFSGTADEIPIRETWERKLVGGISLDMRYVTGLFRRGT
jgi:hypothetical protein